MKTATEAAQAQTSLRNRTTTNNQASVMFLLFLLQLVLAFPVLTPNLNDIGAFDEASYVELGRTFGVHSLPALNQYPLAGFLLALTYIPVHAADFWFVYSCTISRFVLLALLWIGLYRVATQAMSAFSLAQLISFWRGGKLTNLRLASVFVGLALLSRMGEGTFLFGSLIVLTVLLGKSTGRVQPALAAATMPFAVIVTPICSPATRSVENPPLERVNISTLPSNRVMGRPMPINSPA
jgi:hypothetical protein